MEPFIHMLNSLSFIIVFGIVFSIVAIEGAVVTINTQLLGVTLSFFQSICLIGYCLFPLTIAALLNMIFANLALF